MIRGILIVTSYPTSTLAAIRHCLQGVTIIEASSLRERTMDLDFRSIIPNDFEITAAKNCVTDDVDWLLRCLERRAIWRAVLRVLKQWHSRVLKPWLRIAKRFDWRSSPRWSRLKWRSKT